MKQPMVKTSTSIIFGLLFIVGAITSSLQVMAHDEDTFAQAEDLIQQKISCSELSEDQLVLIGEYYMEKMHPGEAHEIMDNMMGGEGSKSLRQVHLSMGRRLYCNDTAFPSYSSYGMMGCGMMGNYPTYYSNYGYWSFFWIVFLVAAIVLIAVFVYKYLIKKPASEPPLRILKKRFARGEITKKQFDDMRKDLEE